MVKAVFLDFYGTVVHEDGAIIKKVTHETLKKNKNVIEYKTYYFNDGMTIVKLKI